VPLLPPLIGTQTAVNHGRPDTARKWFFVAGTVFIAGISLLILLVVGSIVVAMVLPAMHQARSRAQAIAAEERLREARQTQYKLTMESWMPSQISNQLYQAGVRYQALTLEFSGDLATGECRFTGLEALAEAGSSNVWSAIAGRLDLTRGETDRWQAQGDGELGHIRFEITPPANTGFITH